MDAGRLHRAKEAGILQPVQSEKLQENAPLAMSTRWQRYGLTVRARVLVYAKGRVKPSELSTYEDLASSKWRARLTVRSSEHLQPISPRLHHRSQWSREGSRLAKAVRKNMSGPRAEATVIRRAVASGLADEAIMNTYYLGILANSTTEADREVARKVGVFFPNQKGRGAHVNASGGGVTRAPKQGGDPFSRVSGCPNPEKPWRSQLRIPGQDREQPIHLLKSWGTFKPDGVNLSILGSRNAEAVRTWTELDGSKLKPV